MHFQIKINLLKFAFLSHIFKHVYSIHKQEMSFCHAFHKNKWKIARKSNKTLLLISIEIFLQQDR